MVVKSQLRRFVVQRGVDTSLVSRKSKKVEHHPKTVELCRAIDHFNNLNGISDTTENKDVAYLMDMFFESTEVKT